MKNKLTIAAVFALIMVVMRIGILYLETKNDGPDVHIYDWRQPESVTTNYPIPITQDSWSFDYEHTELVLQEVELDEQGALIVNADMAGLLKRAVSELPTNMHELALQRLRFLTFKGLPGPAGEQLASILERYYRYQQAKINLPGREGSKVGLAKNEEIFQQKLELKQQFLGKVLVEALFGQKHLLRNYLFSRRKINENVGLSQQQKKQILTQLEQKFKLKNKIFKAKLGK